MRLLEKTTQQPALNVSDELAEQHKRIDDLLTTTTTIVYSPVKVTEEREKISKVLNVKYHEGNKKNHGILGDVLSAVMAA